MPQSLVPFILRLSFTVKSKEADNFPFSFSLSTKNKIPIFAPKRNLVKGAKFFFFGRKHLFYETYKKMPCYFFIALQFSWSVMYSSNWPIVVSTDRIAADCARDDATLQLVPCCYRLGMPRFEEQNVIIYIFKSPAVINISGKNR